MRPAQPGSCHRSPAWLPTCLPACPEQVPDVALPKAEALAYSEFPDEGHLANLHSGRGGGGAPHHRLLASAHRPASCLTRLRRHSSPRQFSGRMSGGGGGRLPASVQQEVPRLASLHAALCLLSCGAGSYDRLVLALCLLPTPVVPQASRRRQGGVASAAWAMT